MKHIVLAAILWLALQIDSAQGQGIGITNGTANVSWPLTHYHYLVQSSTNFADSNAWSSLGSASPATESFTFPNPPVFTNFSGNNLYFTQPATNNRQFFRLKAPNFVPLFCFAVFYDGLMEFSDSPTMVFNGLVHANGPIYVGPGSGSLQAFNGTVTTSSTISRPGNAGFPTGYWPDTVSFNANPPFATNIPAFVSPMGTNNPHAFIDIPPLPALEPVMSLPGRTRFYNYAQVVLIVTNSPAGGSPRVLLTLQTADNGLLPGADATKIIYDLTNATEIFLKTNANGGGKIALPFLSLTNTFVDQRQGPNGQFVTQINVNQLNSWLTTNPVVLGKFSGGNFPTILYVADRRNLNTTTQSVVRLINGAKLPFNNGLGFTVVTQNPLYVKGNYNVTINSNTYAMGLGSTTNGSSVPAALIADAITILSPNWQDNTSPANYSSRNAANMTINAALLCGNVPSTGTTATTFSGGVQNLPRFLENWTGDVFILNTSLVCLYSSQIATNQFVMPGTYFAPPIRLWGFDTTLLSPNQQPPGTPAYTLP